MTPHCHSRLGTSRDLLTCHLQARFEEMGRSVGSLLGDSGRLTASELVWQCRGTGETLRQPFSLWVSHPTVLPHEAEEDSASTDTSRVASRSNPTESSEATACPDRRLSLLISSLQQYCIPLRPGPPGCLMVVLDISQVHSDTQTLSAKAWACYPSQQNTWSLLISV